MSRTPLPVDDPLAEAYLLWCATDRRESPHTIRRRRVVLRAVGNPGTCTREELEAWWTTRAKLPDGKPRSASSRANDLTILRGFYTWCQIWEHRHDDPSIRLRPPRADHGHPRPATRREFTAILDYLATLGDLGAKLRRAVLLGVWAGLRVSEAAALSWPDIDPDTLQARVLGKGRKTRLVTLDARLVDELLPDTGGNVVTGTARGWKPDTLGHHVNAAIHAAVPGDPNLTFHKLRHRYGSLAYQRTKDPKALADQMGHASVSTTMAFYAAAADEAAAAIAGAVVDD